jgi:hypothetical protein
VVAGALGISVPSLQRHLPTQTACHDMRCTCLPAACATACKHAQHAGGASNNAPPPKHRCGPNSPIPIIAGAMSLTNMALLGRDTTTRVEPSGVGSTLMDVPPPASLPCAPPCCSFAALAVAAAAGAVSAVIFGTTFASAGDFPAGLHWAAQLLLLLHANAAMLCHA